MKQNSLKKWLSVIGCIVLIAALALTTIGCGSKEEAKAPVSSSDAQIMGEGAKVFQFSVVDAEQKETKYEIHTDETTVGAALISLGLIEGEEGPYGLYVMKVCGIEAIYEQDGAYWAFYEDGQYGLTGVDLTEIDPNVAYSFVYTKE